MDRKDKNIKPGDSEIVTKKGFLIAPPSKKKPTAFKIEAEGAQKDNKQSKDKKNEQKPQNKKPLGFGKNRPDKNKKNENTQTQPEKQEKQTTQNTNHKNEHPDRQKHQNQKGDRRQHNQRDNKRHQDKKQHQNNQKHNQPAIEKNNSQKKIEKPVENKPSILGDLGFSSGAFFKTTKKDRITDINTEETTEKIDYSKMPSLREQIYGEKKPKPQITEQEQPEITEGTEIIGVRFKEAGKIYYFDPDSKQASFGTPVIVETARGLEYGITAIANRVVPVNTIIAPLKKIIRLATPEDKERLDANKMLEKQAESVFVEKVQKLGLEMTLVGVEYTFDNTKLLFYFASDGRIDFRELVKELASVFRTRIELRQVGVRDEAKLLGGLGICGRPLCCKTFLGEFAQVSIKMAKDQNLSLNSSKISGTCGRLLCCLRYEDEVYQEEYRRTPKVDAIVETPEGKGVVVEAFPLKGTVKVRLDAKQETTPQTFRRDDVKILGYLKRNDQSVDAELKELEKEL